VCSSDLKPLIKRDVEIAYLGTVEKDTLAAYEEFLLQFPNHSHSVTVRQIVKARSDDKVWQRTRRKNTRTAYQQYLLIFPDGAYKDEAHTQLAAIAARSGVNSGNGHRSSQIAKQEQNLVVDPYRVIDHEDWDVLNVRRGPGTKYVKLFGIPYNADNVIVHKCRQVSGFAFSWCVVDYNGKRGWAYGRYLAHVRTGNRPN